MLCTINSLDNRLLHAVGHSDQIRGFVSCWLSLLIVLTNTLPLSTLSSGLCRCRHFCFGKFNRKTRAVSARQSEASCGFRDDSLSYWRLFAFTVLRSISRESVKKGGIVKGGCCLPPRAAYESVWTVSAGLEQRARFCSYLNVLSLSSSHALSYPSSLSVSLCSLRIPVAGTFPSSS